MLIGLASMPSGYVLRFPGTCDFDISRHAGRVRVRPGRNVDPAEVERLLVDQVLPRCLAHRGHLVVHAAGIAIGRKVALFVGESGRGKSTLAGSFFRAGRTVLTDDCMVLRPGHEVVRSVPTYASLRLHEDSAAALFGDDPAGATPRTSLARKRRIRVPRVASGCAAARVAAVYFLGEPTPSTAPVRIEPLAPSAACIRLMEQCFQLDILDGHCVGRLLAQASDVISRTSSFALDFPRDFERTPELLTAIEQHFARTTAAHSAARRRTRASHVQP